MNSVSGGLWQHKNRNYIWCVYDKISVRMVTLIAHLKCYYMGVLIINSTTIHWCKDFNLLQVCSTVSLSYELLSAGMNSCQVIGMHMQDSIYKIQFCSKFHVMYLLSIMSIMSILSIMKHMRKLGQWHRCRNHSTGSPHSQKFNCSSRDYEEAGDLVAFKQHFKQWTLLYKV